MSTPTRSRPNLTRERVLAGACALADEVGLEGTTMRPLAERLGVTPMALYNHVSGREDLVDGMVDTLVLEVLDDPSAAPEGEPWRHRVRHRVLRARGVISGHPWAVEAVETRTHASPVVLDYMDALMGDLRSGGLSLDLVHHAMHALGTRMWGLTRDVFPTDPTPADPEERRALLAEAATRYPNIVEMTTGVARSGGGCDADAEFAFALDLLLDGIDARHRSGWTPDAAGT